MVLEYWGVGDAAVEVLRHPLLNAQYAFGLRWKKADSLSSQSRKYLWTEQWREADASYIWVRLSPHFVSLDIGLPHSLKVTGASGMQFMATDV